MNIIKKLITIITFAISININAQSTVEKEDLHIFILMGQSNMAGFATLKEIDSIPQKNMYTLLGQKKSKWGTKFKSGTEEIKWIKAKHPLHAVHDSDRFGMAINFAKEYLKNHPNAKIGFIPCAYGGASIDKLNKGTEIYTNAIERINFAKKSGTIKAILWHQGESDTVNPELANSYENKLHKLIKDLRTDINISNLPFIVGDLANFYGIDRNSKHIEGIITVRQTLRNLPQKIPHTGFVESTGLSWQGEGYVHFDRNSYIEFGKRYKKIYSNLISY